MTEPWTRASVDRAMLLCWAVGELEKAGKVPHFNDNKAMLREARKGYTQPERV